MSSRFNQQSQLDEYFKYNMINHIIYLSSMDKDNLEDKPNTTTKWSNKKLLPAKLLFTVRESVSDVNKR